MHPVPLTSAVVALVACVSLAQDSRTNAQRPARDTPGQPTTPTNTAVIAGRVLTIDSGRPVRRARVFAVGPDLPEGRATMTGDDGAFELTELPASRYTLTVSKAGYVTLAYGQRRPLQAGTPLQVGAGQRIGGIDFRLPRGSIIAGHVVDDAGDPAPGTTVRVLRHEYRAGVRQLVPAGTAQTDDQGAFRVWGLNPGRYFVSAVQRNPDVGPGGPGGRGRGPAPPASDDPTQQAYAPTYFPGVGSVSEAAAVTVGVGEETGDVNFAMLLVRTVRITGTATNSSGSPVTNGLVSLTPEGVASRSRNAGTDFNGRIDGEGRFSIANVPPGQYTLRAASNGPDRAQYAVQPLSVFGAEISNLSLILYPGATITGSVRFEGTNAPDLRQVRITAPAPGNVALGPNPIGRIDRDGRFVIDPVPAGTHWIRAGDIRGWSLKSVILDGREVVDAPIELSSGQKLSDVAIVFTSRQSEINGTIVNEQSVPVTDVTVLAFPTDSSLWQPMSRQIVTARPDQNGSFRMRGLPAGDYYLSLVDPSEPGEWYEPAFLDEQRIGAARLSLGEGDVKTHDFRRTTR